MTPIRTECRHAERPAKFVLYDGSASLLGRRGPNLKVLRHHHWNLMVAPRANKKGRISAALLAEMPAIEPAA